MNFGLGHMNLGWDFTNSTSFCGPKEGRNSKASLSVQKFENMAGYFVPPFLGKLSHWDTPAVLKACHPAPAPSPLYSRYTPLRLS